MSIELSACEPYTGWTGEGNQSSFQIRGSKRPAVPLRQLGAERLRLPDCARGLDLWFKKVPLCQGHFDAVRVHIQRQEWDLYAFEG
ncbi:MAG TPA: hypothetical protein VMW62_07140, partial [Chloroflexota bacterium]|nr:hypothetical protein [Chloroflexota bacterium]